MNATRRACRTSLPCLALAALLAAPAAADVRLDVVANADPARPGELLDLELTITNDGPFARNDLRVHLDYPEGLQRLYDRGFEGSCSGGWCDVGDVMSFTIESLPAGKGTTFSVPARVVVDADDGTVIPFDVTVLDDGDVQVIGSASIEVSAGREIDLAMADTRDPVAPGELLTYVIAYGVREDGSGSPAATLELPLPASTSFVSADGGGIESGGVVEWSLGNLQPGAGGERRVTVAVAGERDPGTIIRATARYADDSGNAVANGTSTRVEETIPLDLAIVASPDPARAGEVLDVEITVTNTGPFGRTGVVARLEFPEHIARLYDALFDGTCSGGWCDTSDRAWLDVGTLPAGAGRTFSIPLMLEANTLDGTVVALEAQVRDATGDMREHSTAVRAASSRTLELAVVADRDPARPGGTLEYRLAAGTLETGAGAPDAEARLVLPDGVAFMVASDGGNESDGVVTWPLGNMNPGASGERRVIVQVDADADAGTLLVARAALDDTAGDLVAYDVVTRVADEAPLAVAIIASPDPARPEEVLDVELTVTNTGPLERTNIVAWIEIPEHLARLYAPITDGTCSGGWCDTRDRLRFEVGDLASGEGRTFSIPFQVDTTALDGTVLSLEATARDDAGARRGTGAHLTVDSDRAVDLALVESHDPAGDKDRITYTLTYAADELGAGSPDGALRLDLAPGTTLIAASHGGEANGDAVEWPVGVVEPGDGGERRVTVEIDGDTSDDAALEIAARFDDGRATPSQVRFSETTRVQASAPLDVELNVTPNPARPGDTLEVIVSVTNTTGLERTAIQLWFEYPEDLQRLYDRDLDGSCSGGWCDPRDRVGFPVPVLGAGETATFTMPPIVTTTAIEGTVINFDATARDATGFVADDGDAVLIGGDLDGPAGDANFDGRVDVTDLLLVLVDWGDCDDPDRCPADFNGDGVIDVTDLLIVLVNWS